jgi:predicted DsbA family dithiol-disulfide isomerase
MDEAAVAQRLGSGEDEDTIKERLQQSIARGISGVPFFVINDKYGISGAQPAATLVSAFDQIAAAEDSEGSG